MSHPFDDPDSEYLVLVNHEEHHSLWPAFADVPTGWRVLHGPSRRDDCLAFVNTHWTDMRPLSVRQSLADLTES